MLIIREKQVYNKLFSQFLLGYFKVTTITPQSKRLPTRLQLLGDNHNHFYTVTTTETITTITKAEIQLKNKKPLQIILYNGFSLWPDARKARKYWDFGQK